MRNRIVCVDIGSENVKVVVGTKTAEGLEIVEKTSVPAQGVEYGVVTDVEQCSQALKRAFANVKAHENDFIVVGLSNYYVESTKSMQSKFIADGKRISEEDTNELFEKAENAYLKEELKKLDVCLQFYNVEDISGIQNPIGMNSAKLEASYTIFSCRRTLLGSLEECVNKAGFQVDEFTFSPCYLGDLLIEDEDKEAGVLLVDLGADTTRVSVFVDKALYASFALPFGGNSLTTDIKNSYPLTLKQAEVLKKKFGCALADKADESAEVGFKSADAWGERSLRVSQLAGVLQCRLDEIFRGIRYHLKKIALEELIEEVVFIGGGAKQTMMQAYLEKQFKVPAREATVKSNAFLNVGNVEMWQYSNALGMLYFELQEANIEDTQNVGFLERVRSFFGKRSSGEDTQM